MTKPTLSFTLQPKFFTALLRFCGRDETRYVLNGVLVEARGKKLILVATDGRRMAVLNVTDEASPVDATVSCIVPISLLSAMPKPSAVASGLIFTLSEEEVRITGQTTISAKPIEGSFPNWRQVVPTGKPTPMNAMTFNAGLLDDFIKVARLLNKDGSVKLTQHGGDSAPFAVRLWGYAPFLGVLMPVRGDENEIIPKWATE